MLFTQNWHIKCVPIRKNSVDAAQDFANESLDMVYIDGSHTEEDVYQDVLAWHEKLKQGGIMCGDDWHCQGVKNGVRRALEKLDINMESLSAGNSFWTLEPKA